MPKASPMTRSFSSGEFSELMDGRVDLDRYPSSLRRLRNAIAAPQGPAICRSGTAFLAPVRDESKVSHLSSFVFSEDQASVLEFSEDRIRFFSEDGLQVYDAVQARVTPVTGEPMPVTAAGLDAEVGDQVVLSGFPSSHNLNGRVANITSKVDDDYVLDVEYPNGFVVEDGMLSRVYHVACSYTQDQRENLRFVQSVDVTYLLTPGVQTRKLSRFGNYDWRLENVEFFDGPYMPTNTTPTTLTPSGTGNAIPEMTSNTLPSGECTGSSVRPAVNGTAADPAPFLGRNLTYQLPASEFYFAFDSDDDTFWSANEAQQGFIAYEPATPFVCDGYTIYAAKDNQDTSYVSSDYPPSTFTFEGFDGTDWVVIDTQNEYVLYEGNKSVFIEINNEVAYERYRLNVANLVRNGQIEPRVRRLVMREAGQASFDLTASSTTNINADRGFLPTDVGRLVRLKGSDGSWRSCEITAVASTTVVTVKLIGEPLIDTKAITDWRLGYWSDTTGWPSQGTFFEDRLWLFGSVEAPDLFAGSVTADYENFQQTDTFGVVLDDSAVVARLNARKLSSIRWVESDDRGVLVGTGSEEYALSSPDGDVLTARNVRARPSTRRGSANVEPVRVDNQVLFVQRSGRAVREHAFVFQDDGYRAPSMSQLASHLGVKTFVEMDYAAEPHSIIWFRRAEGSVVGLTYNREENVVGWHQHDMSDGYVESLTVVPQKDQLQDALWVSVRRDVGGVQRRFVERLTRFWDFDTELSDAHFVDSGLRYVGEPTSVLFGLTHLEGEVVYGLADGRPVGPFTVASGSVELPFPASNVVVGLGYESSGVLPRLEAGAADGTAQGKTKRVHSIALSLWRSAGGEVGMYNKNLDEFVYEPIEFPRDFDRLESVELYTGIIEPVRPGSGYDREALVAFRKPKESTLPFNVTAVMPQVHTQDG